MAPDDIEREARAFESSCVNYTHAAKRSLYEAESHARAGELCAAEAARELGLAAGFAFRAQELRYDARGGMTAATERRRFEPGARWALDGEEHTIEHADDSGYEPRLRSSEESYGHWERTSDMTRANGWLFLGLSDQGGYR